MAVGRILSGTIIVFAFVLGLMEGVGFHGIAIAGDWTNSDGDVAVDNPGGGKRWQYKDKVKLPAWQDLSGAWHQGDTTDQGSAVWFPKGSQQPVTPPPPPSPPSVSGSGGAYGDPGDSTTASNDGNNSGVGDTPPQVPPNYVPPSQQNSQQSGSGRGGNNYRNGGFTAQELSRMSPEERELARRNIIHKHKYGN
jgi:hypothetical protein